MPSLVWIQTLSHRREDLMLTFHNHHQTRNRGRTQTLIENQADRSQRKSSKLFNSSNNSTKWTYKRWINSWRNFMTATVITWHRAINRILIKQYSKQWRLNKRYQHKDNLSYLIIKWRSSSPHIVRCCKIGHYLATTSSIAQLFTTAT